jgi:hypothetical protein
MVCFDKTAKLRYPNRESKKGKMQKLNGKNRNPRKFRRSKHRSLFLLLILSPFLFPPCSPWSSLSSLLIPPPPQVKVERGGRKKRKTKLCTTLTSPITTIFFFLHGSTRDLATRDRAKRYRHKNWFLLTISSESLVVLKFFRSFGRKFLQRDTEMSIWTQEEREGDQGWGREGGKGREREGIRYLQQKRKGKRKSAKVTIALFLL